MRKIFNAFKAAVFVLLLTGLLAACSATGGSSSTNISGVPMVNPSSYEQSDLFRVGDFLTVKLRGVPAEDEQDFEMRVDESGNISLPHIGNLRAAGLTTVQVKDKIEAMYRMGRIYTDPVITVTSMQARFISVTGEVRAPQRMPHGKDLTALGAIATCGGFTDFANRRRVKILRGGSVIEFNALEILRDPGLDIPLLPDDRIQVDRSIF